MELLKTFSTQNFRNTTFNIPLSKQKKGKKDKSSVLKVIVKRREPCEQIWRFRWVILHGHLLVVLFVVHGKCNLGLYRHRVWASSAVCCRRISLMQVRESLLRLSIRFNMLGRSAFLTACM